MVLASSFVVHSIRRFLDAAAGSSEAAASSSRSRRIVDVKPPADCSQLGAP